MGGGERGGAGGERGLWHLQAAQRQSSVPVGEMSGKVEDPAFHSKIQVKVLIVMLNLEFVVVFVFT